MLDVQDVVQPLDYQPQAEASLSLPPMVAGGGGGGVAGGPPPGSDPPPPIPLVIIGQELWGAF